MNSGRVVLLALACAVAMPRLGSAGQSAARNLSTAEKERYFEERVRPVFANNCLECHGSRKQKSGLRLDSRASMLAGGDSGEVIVPGNPEQSRLVEVIRYPEDDVQMPPKGRLPQKDIDALVTWISIGAPWPAGETIQTAAGMDKQDFERARRTHWAYQPIKRPPLPDVQDSEQVASPVDRFVLARLESAGLSFSPEADRQTLIRRATFDLIGLPPTAEEVDAFISDDSPDAYARLVDRLLASPHYGECWGRHWLDVARYADTKGHIFQQERGFAYAYTYRDYVIRAFNKDLPYDRFVLEQIAADQLDSGDDRDALAAMGFLTVGRRFGTDIPEVIDDRIDVVTRGLLGLTVACARCHDHKYDAIPTADYYSLYGVFASSREPLTLPLIAEPQDTPAYEEFSKKHNPLQHEFEQFLRDQHKLITETARKRVADYLVEVVTRQPEELLGKQAFLSLSPDELKPEVIVRWRNYLQERARPEDPVFGAWHDLMELDDEHIAERAGDVVARWNAVPVGTAAGELNPLVKQAISETTFSSKAALATAYGRLFSDVYLEWTRSEESAEAAVFRNVAPPPVRQILDVLLGVGSPTNLTIDDVPGSLARVDYAKYQQLTNKLNTVDVHSPGAPPRAMVLVDAPQLYDPVIFIRGDPTRAGKRVPRQFLRLLAGPNREPFRQGSGRLELARAIVAEDNPLTARVLVNRVWMHHFGWPLVQTPSDFGVRSEPPSHPGLLDYLASEFRKKGWSLKTLHREIMLSHTYRQASLERPECLGADPNNRLYWRMNRRRLEFEAMRDSVLAVTGTLDYSMGGRPVDVVAKPFSRRRTVYGTVDRQDLPSLFRIFDFANPDQSAAERSQTTVPQQALFAMNSPFVIEQAKYVAAREDVVTRANSEARIRALYRAVLSRNPTAEEMKAGLAFIRDARIAGADDESAAMSPWDEYAQVLLWTNEFLFVD